MLEYLLCANEYAAMLLLVVLSLFLCALLYVISAYYFDFVLKLLR